MATWGFITQFCLLLQMFEDFQNKKKRREKEGGKQAGREGRRDGEKGEGRKKQHKREENPTIPWPTCKEEDMW